MAAKKFNPVTPNNEVGVYFIKSRAVTVDVPFGETACWIKSTVGGVIVFKNSVLGEVSVIGTEAGEAIPIVCDEIVSSATIDGTLYTTTATGMYWITVPQQLTR